MQTQSGGDVRCGIGARLRAARERSELTLMQAAERLHVDPSLILALEAEDFDSFGAPVYARGHLKRYAELVGEKASELERDYVASREPTAPPDLTRIARGPPAPDRRALLAPGLAILGAIALIGLVWWVMRAFDSANVVPADDATPAIDAAPPAGASLLPPPSVPPESREPAPREARSLAAQTAAPRAASPTTGPRAATDSAGATVRAAALAARSSAPQRAELTLRFAADSWAEVYDANGARLFYDVGSADTTRTLTGPAPLRVVLGNASGVAVTVNGRETMIPDTALRDGEARFVVNPSGRIVRSRIASSGSVP